MQAVVPAAHWACRGRLKGQTSETAQFHDTVATMSTSDFSESSPTSNEPSFTDRRNPDRQRKSNGLERRQFSDGHNNLSPDAAEIGQAVDQYKLENHRRFVTYEELLNVIKSLGYEKTSNG